MREFLTSGLVGNIDYNIQKQIRWQVQSRWEFLGFTEGLPEDSIKENIDTLYENEAKYPKKLTSYHYENEDNYQKKLMSYHENETKYLKEVKSYH